MRNISNASQMDPPGLSPKKTLFIMVTVVGCIAILWPKVFYPMMFGGPVKQNPIKDHRGGTASEKSSVSLSCCEVVLDKDAFFNASLTVSERPYRKHINLYTGEISLRQERPPHLRPDSIHPAMRERGRAIPATPTVPIVERARAQSSPPRVVEGRPGPIPGMRPPLGAGSVHQAPQKTGSMGFIMPLYTIGIVAFFIYTIMKILFKKPVSNPPYGTSRADPGFHKEVFGHDKSCCSGTKLGLLDAADEQLKIREKSTNLTKDTSENIQQNANGHANPIQSSNDLSNSKIYHNELDKQQQQQQTDNFNNSDEINHHHHQQHQQHQQHHHHHHHHDHHKNHSDDGVIEKKSDNENLERKQLLDDHLEKSVVSNVDDEKPDPELIYLEGALPHESQILVADSKTEKENIVDEEFNGSIEEPAVVLSSKMTLSLINLDSDNTDENKNQSNDKDNTLDHDMEIINGEEQEVKRELTENK